MCVSELYGQNMGSIDDETGEFIIDEDGEKIGILFVEDFKKSDYHGIQKEYFNNGTLKSISFISMVKILVKCLLFRKWRY